MNRDLWNDIVKENMDISDRDTLKIMCSINEADQNQVVAALASKLYDSIVKKITDIDFGQIPNSKGDITKIPNYFEMSECLSNIRELLVANRQSTTPVDTIITAIDNLKSYKNIWTKGYNIDCEMVVVMYNTIALSIVTATSVLLTTMIEFIKNPESGTYEACLVKVKRNNTKDGLLFKNLAKFNKSCKKGDIEKTMTAILKSQRAMRENGIITESIFATVLAGVTLISLATCIIPIIHELTSLLYCMRQKVSDYFDLEADIVRLNAEKVNYSKSKTPEAKKKIVARQMKIADRFKAISNKLAIKSKKAEVDADKMVKSENSKKFKVDELLDEIPDSASLF